MRSVAVTCAAAVAAVVLGAGSAQAATTCTPFSACNEPGGLTQVNFSSVIELFG